VYLWWYTPGCTYGGIPGYGREHIYRVVYPGMVEGDIYTGWYTRVWEKGGMLGGVYPGMGREGGMPGGVYTRVWERGRYEAHRTSLPSPVSLLG